MDGKRGSEKLLMAWKKRALTEDSVQEIAKELDTSRGKVEQVNVVGGSAATGISVVMSYDGDDVPWCGNDIAFWLKWHRTHGGVVRPPRIIINGIPNPEWIRVQLDFGHVGGDDLGERVDVIDELGNVGFGGR